MLFSWLSRLLVPALVLPALLFAEGCASLAASSELPASTASDIPEWPFVLPTPQRVLYGDVVEFGGWHWSEQAVPAGLAADVRAVCGPSVGGGIRLALKTAPRLRPQEYRLAVTQKKALLEASAPEGFYYGLQSLRNLQGAREGAPEGGRIVRLATIHDWPALETRGLITGLDWSKQMGAMKFNLLQYPGGRGDLSPRRREDYLALVDDCSAQRIQFLSHEGYKGTFWDNETLFDFSPEGYEKLKAYYKVRFDMGARAFTVAFDDMKIPEGEGAALARKHAEACVIIRDYLQALDPACVLYFCPVPYGGPGKGGKFVFSGKKDARIYLKTIGSLLPGDVRVYWTGLSVFSPEVDTATADIYAGLIGRKPFFWDNDSLHWLKERRPLSGRPADFLKHTSGYVANIADRKPDGTQSELLPVVLTIADYLWNPAAYDSTTSMERARRFAAGAGGGQ